MTIDRMKAILAEATRLLASRQLSLVYLVAWDAEAGKFCATAGDSLGNHARLKELRAFCDEQLKDAA